MKKAIFIGAAGGLLWAGAFMLYAGWPLLRWGIGLAGLTMLLSLWTRPQAQQQVQRKPRDAAAGSFAFGLIAFTVACHWIYYSVRIVNGGPVALAALLVVLLAALMACWYALGGYWATRISPHRNWLAPLVILPSVLVLAEWLRGWVFTGFPWLQAGYLSGGVFAGRWPAVLASTGGVYLIGWLTAALASACLLILRSRLAWPARALILLVLVGGIAGLGHIPFPEGSLRSSGDLRARLVQGGITQERKWLTEEYQPTLLTYEKLSFGRPWRDAPQQRPDLIIWPEIAIPSTREAAADYLAELDRLMRRRDMALALGILTDTGKGRFNSLIVLGEGEGESVYHKSHLVPFGEFFPVPNAVRDWLMRMGLPSNDLLAGPSEQAPLLAGGAICGASICYEAAFGSEQRGWTPEAEVLINVSNDGWFGNTVALDQHLEMARMRAMEAGRYLLRVTGTGITAAVDRAGRIVARLPKHEAGFLDARVPRLSGTTLYARFGDWPVVILCLLLGVALPAAIRLTRRQRAAGPWETWRDSA